MKRFFSTLLLALLALLTLWAPLVQAQVPLKFGVLAYRTKTQITAHWQPLAAHLQTALGRPVELTVYSFPELEAAMAKNEVDVLLTNPGHFILLRHRNSLSAPLATQITQEGGHEMSSFGGVMFTRSEAANINTLADLAGRRIAISSQDSLGGYQMQAFELLQAGIRLPGKDQWVTTGMPQDRVVDAVLAGQADVGFVRSGVLEAMALERQFDLGRIKILNRQNLSTFPYVLSTRLYPEWPVSVMPQVDEHTARRLTVALISLDENSAVMKAAGIHGFTVPADYGGVEDVLRRLRVPPYNAAPELTWEDLWAKFHDWIVALGVLALLLLGVGVRLLVQNRRIWRNKQHLLAVQADLQSTLNAVPDLMFEVGLDGRYYSVRTPHADLLVAPVDVLIGKRVTDVMPAQAAATCLAALQEANDTGYANGQHIELRIDGLRKWFELSVARKESVDADQPRFIVLSRDITERKQADEKLQLAASVFTYAREGIMITDTQGIIVDVNDTFTAITGFSRDEVLGQNPRMLKSGRQGADFYAAMWVELNEIGHWTGEAWNRRKNGEVYAEMQTISAVRDSAGKTKHYVSMFTDITPMKVHQQQLEHMAHYDALTGLPNRVLLADRLQQAMLQCHRRSRSLAVVYLDLDGFKLVNDCHGHDVGDALLITIAQRMKAALRDGDTLARIGGDEFVAVLVDLESTKDWEPVLGRLLHASAEPITVEEVVLQVSSSIGVTIFPRDRVDADQLMRHADQAMYQAKLGGKNRYHLFDVENDTAIKTQQESLMHIARALEQREFVLYYQPKVNMRTRAIIGAEALIRWQHPERGLVPPGDFLPTIEGHPISIALGEWVIDTALCQISHWQSCGLMVPVSVNVSACQLQENGFSERLASLLAAHPDVAPSSLELEVLETSALEDVLQVSQVMHACQAMGVRFALDDFGTGYSSLTYLKNLSAEVIKIDQSFVRDMLDDPDDLSIIQGVIGLAKSFNREVIAEGVETDAHGAMLLQLGCELAQGYGIARPMPAGDFPKWAAHWQGTDGEK